MRAKGVLYETEPMTPLFRDVGSGTLGALRDDRDYGGERWEKGREGKRPGCEEKRNGLLQASWIRRYGTLFFFSWVPRRTAAGRFRRPDKTDS